MNHAAHDEGPGEQAGGWREHMHVQGEGRQRKASKLVALLAQNHPLDGARILDIGTGTGFIAADLARAAGPAGAVTSVDVMDNRLVTDGFEFQRITGTTLAFASGSFDLVVSNHVIEHVGPGSSRQHHLDEIARVLAPTGVCYLATPSRWAPVEPHFKVPLLSWLPESWRSRYLRATRRGTHYDVYPLGPRQLDRAASYAGLSVQDLSASAVGATVAERGTLGRRLAGLIQQIPAPVWQLLSRLLPTHVRLLGHSTSRRLS